VDILADENLDRPLVEWLRQQGHDVLWMTEFGPGRTDDEVLSAASPESRILLTFDLDFGGLVFRLGRKAAGIVLLRLRTRSAAELLRLFTKHWPKIEEKARGRFLVVSNSRIRIRPLPE